MFDLIDALRSGGTPSWCKTLLLLLATCVTTPGVADDGKLPASLAQWYKPQSERQVWLHTMFSLRREMQAVEEYVDAGEFGFAGKWAGKLAKHYLSIGEMVPEWREKLDPKALAALTRGVSGQDQKGVGGAIRDLQRTCRFCHNRYRALAAARFRAPDFSAIRVADGDGGERDYDEAMEALSRTVNRVAIAGADSRWRSAAEQLGRLRGELDYLAESCVACHPDRAPRARIFGNEVQQGMDALAHSIEQQDASTFGRNLGDVAVQVCARCHGVHRTVYDLTEELLR